jgi:hypothetical protein
MDDFEAAFNEAVAEVEANPDSGTESNLPPQATIHMGDEESIGESEETANEDVLDPDTEIVSDEETIVDETDTPVDTSFDWTAHKDDLVTVKVRGEDVSIPLGEALNGYLRHDDYTRKTQEISGQRKMVEAAQQMREALESDPQGTIAALAAAYKVNLAPESDVDDPYQTDDPELAPVMKALKTSEERYARLERQLQAQAQEAQERQILAEVKSEMTDVKNEFPDFDPQKVLPIAAEMNIPMRQAYLMLKGEEAISGQSSKAAQAAEAAKVAATAAAARKASNTANKGGSARTAAAPKVEKDFDSFAELLEDALSS